MNTVGRILYVNGVCRFGAGCDGWSKRAWDYIDVAYLESLDRVGGRYEGTFWGKLPDDSIRGCNELFVLDEEG